jgi:hypothetical protein
LAVRQNLDAGRIHSARADEIAVGYPMRLDAWGVRDIVLAGCLINFYAK